MTVKGVVLRFDAPKFLDSDTSSNHLITAYPVHMQEATFLLSIRTLHPIQSSQCLQAPHSNRKSRGQAGGEKRPCLVSRILGRSCCSLTIRLCSLEGPDSEYQGYGTVTLIYLPTVLQILRNATSMSTYLPCTQTRDGHF